MDQFSDQAKDAINQRDNNGCTSLFWACQAGHSPVVQLLLERGADPNVSNRRGETPLHAACANGSTASIKALLDKGARSLTTDNRGMTVLHHAALNVSLISHQGLVPRLTQLSFNLRDQFLNILIKGHLDAVKCLFDNVEAEDLLSVKDREGMLPLHAAIVSTNLPVTRFILERMVELDEPLDRKDKSGMTPLHLAVSMNDENITPLLVFYLNQTQNINAFNARDDSKETPLFYAVRNGNTNLARFLLQNRADANLLNSEKESTLFVAVREKNEDMVQLLLEMGADTSIRNMRGETPFEAEEIPEPVTKPRTWPLTQLTPAKPAAVPTSGSPTNTTTPVIKVPSPQTTPKVQPSTFTPTPTPSSTNLAPLVTGPTKQSPVLSPVSPTRLGITDSTIEYITRELGGPKTSIATHNKEETALIMQLDRLQQEMRERDKREEQYKSKIISSEQEMLNMKGQIEMLMKQVQNLSAVMAGDRV